MAGKKKNDKTFQRLATNPWAFSPVRAPMLVTLLAWALYLVLAVLGAAAMGRQSGMGPSMRIAAETMLGIATLVTLGALWWAGRRSLLPAATVALIAVPAALAGRWALAALLLLVALVVVLRFGYSAWRDNRLSYGLTRQASTMLLHARPSLRNSMPGQPEPGAHPGSAARGPISPPPASAGATRS